MASKTTQNISETMEDAMNSIKRACELARNLEPKVANMLNNQLEMLLLSIHEVEKAFGASKERLLMMISQQKEALTASSSLNAMLQIGAFKHETETMDQKMFVMQQQSQPLDVRGWVENKMMMSAVDPLQLRYKDKGTLHIGEMGVEGSQRSKGGEGETHGVEASSPSRTRKSRKNDLEKRIELFPAPLVGNMDIPQDDGYTWRKYGQKEILGSKHPRAYYRCTHQKLYGCPAKKQVQRLNENPNIFQVTYRGEHICHKSSTAPSSFPPPPQQLLVDIFNEMPQPAISPQLSPQSTSVSGWISSANLSLRESGRGGGGEPSASRYGADYPVADMADVMFNSGSSSGNSMDSLFPSAEDKS